MSDKTTIRCNGCYKRLTEKEVSVYPPGWRYSGDMYCKRCRDCPDDCRRTPCQIKQVQADDLARQLLSDQTTQYVLLTARQRTRFHRIGVNQGTIGKTAWWIKDGILYAQTHQQDHTPFFQS